MTTTTIQSIETQESKLIQLNIANAYRAVKETVINAGYNAEIKWQESLDFNKTTETDFLREYAWVVLSTGMHEYVIRRHFPKISECFCNWQSAKTIAEQENNCRRRALKIFNNNRKIDSIIETANIIVTLGFNTFRNSIRCNPLETLQSLPFIGSVTCFHLAKNIGLPFAKPDRHLVRLASLLGYNDVQKFCATISESVNDSVPVVDIVLWRFATITKNYLDYFYIASQETERDVICSLVNEEIKNELFSNILSY